MLNKDNPAEAALSKKLSALTNDLQRKQDQINSLNDRKAGGMRQQYDKLVADLLKQQEMLKGKHAELHKKLEESNVCPSFLFGLLYRFCVSMNCVACSGCPEVERVFLC